MATSTDTGNPPVGPDGSAYGNPVERPVVVADCNRFAAFLDVVDAAAAMVDPSDPAGTAARLASTLRQHFHDFHYILATAQPAVWYDARHVIDWLYASGAGTSTDGTAARQALTNVHNWHTANCTNISPH
jgi:hypothetical protein